MKIGAGGVLLYLQA